MPSDEPLRPYNWRPKSLAKLKLINYKHYYEKVFVSLHFDGCDCFRFLV